MKAVVAASVAASVAAAVIVLATWLGFIRSTEARLSAALTELSALDQEVAALEDTARNADALRREQEALRRAAADARQRQAWLAALDAAGENDTVVLRGWVPRELFEDLHPLLSRAFQSAVVRELRGLDSQTEFEATFRVAPP